MKPDALLNAAESAFDSEDSEEALEYLARYRAWREQGGAEPSWSYDQGAGYSKPLVIGGDEMESRIRNQIADRHAEQVKQEKLDAEYDPNWKPPPIPKRARKKRSRNPPASGINRKALKNAVGLYRQFREAEPERLRRITIDIPAALMTMGRVSAIEYETTHNGKSQAYRHDFVPGSRPTIAASGKKNGLFLLGGRYHVTVRGIVDLDPRGREVEDKAGEVIRSK